MTKSRLMRILLIVISVLILVGVILVRCTPSSLTADGGIIKVLLSDRKTHVIEFENLTLLPGEECEYLIMLEHTSAEQCSITLDFREIEEKKLEQFVRVKVISDDNVLCEELLADMFQKEKIFLPVDFTENENTELKIVYFMPAEIGNEAKNTETVFELRITVSNER